MYDLLLKIDSMPLADIFSLVLPYHCLIYLTMFCLSQFIGVP